MSNKQTETYLMVGVRLDLEAAERLNAWGNLEDCHLPWAGIGAVGKVGVLYEPDGERYLVVGKCLAVARGPEGFPLLFLPEGEELKAIQEEVVGVIVANWLDELLPGADNDVREEPVPMPFIVTHIR